MQRMPSTPKTLALGVSVHPKTAGKLVLRAVLPSTVPYDKQQQHAAPTTPVTIAAANKRAARNRKRLLIS